MHLKGIMDSHTSPAPAVPAHSQDEIDLKELFSALWAGKWIIIATTFLAAVISVVVALSLPNIYKSEVLLAPAEENQGGGLSALASQFGGLASLAGVNLSQGGADKTTLALELLKSRSFIGEFVEKHDLKATIMAANGWDMATNRLTYDEDIYNSQTNTWVREVKAPKKPEPSLLEVHEVFVKENLVVTQDEETGLVKISVKHYSPFIAKTLTDELVKAINAKIKHDDIAEANRSIAYLTEALEQTPVADMQATFYALIEKQQQTKMLANVRDEYVLKVIDPPMIPEKKFSPSRVLIVFGGALFGFIISVFLIALHKVIYWQ